VALILVIGAMALIAYGGEQDMAEDQADETLCGTVRTGRAVEQFGHENPHQRHRRSGERPVFHIAAANVSARAMAQASR
jgi:hypothetical protein